ncbi:addiction module antidote protein [Gellertiella hungarica]|uniref:Putative addiction module antidote protein n=1 Tax=Gellertiella hungarica TaxID=1572859 RepID=A0A7W6NJE0_9HYPH|nr:addiction module antidote protein [Gellertiella hungarica]MBB4063384.1 putative addiction module antidote protein [Gellertiella hungarica]
MRSDITPYDLAEGIRDHEDLAVFLALAFDTTDAGEIAHALGIAARSEGMTDIARKAGLSREALYRSLTENGNPTLKSVLAVLDAMGLRLSVVPKEEEHVSIGAPVRKRRQKA